MRSMVRGAGRDSKPEASSASEGVRTVSQQFTVKKTREEMRAKLCGDEHARPISYQEYTALLRCGRGWVESFWMIEKTARWARIR